MTLSTDQPGTASLQRAIKHASEQHGPVIITGERGSGRTHTAKQIHEQSDRSCRRFVDAQFGNIPPSLHSAELLGVKGPFYPDILPRPGRIESAQGGTLCVGGLAPDALDELIRFWKTGIVEPIKLFEYHYVHDVRIVVVAETLEPDDSLVSTLAQCADTIHIAVPLLRERQAEIVRLFVGFTRKIAREQGVSCPVLTAEMISTLQNYSWPGNVSELMDVARHVAITGAWPLALPVPHTDPPSLRRV